MADQAAAEAYAVEAPSPIPTNNSIDQVAAYGERLNDRAGDINAQPNIAASDAEIDIAVLTHRDQRRLDLGCPRLRLLR